MEPTRREFLLTAAAIAAAPNVSSPPPTLLGKPIAFTEGLNDASEWTLKPTSRLPWPPMFLQCDDRCLEIEWFHWQEHKDGPRMPAAIRCRVDGGEWWQGELPHLDPREGHRAELDLTPVGLPGFCVSL